LEETLFICSKHNETKVPYGTQGQHYCLTCNRENVSRNKVKDPQKIRDRLNKAYRDRHPIDLTHKGVKLDFDTPDRDTIIYLAGFFDGEGCIQINKAHRKGGHVSPVYTLGTSAVQVHPEPIKLLLKYFGGSLDTRDENNHRFIYCWRAASELALRFLLMVEPYLLVKKEQASIGIEFQQHKSARKRVFAESLEEAELAFREDCYIKIRDEKHLEYRNEVMF
jgi:hypothetical protein